MLLRNRRMGPCQLREELAWPDLKEDSSSRPGQCLEGRRETNRFARFAGPIDRIREVLCGARVPKEMRRSSISAGPETYLAATSR